jgi:hypothetical protein
MFRKLTIHCLTTALFPNSSKLITTSCIQRQLVQWFQYKWTMSDVRAMPLILNLVFSRKDSLLELLGLAQKKFSIISNKSQRLIHAWWVATL